MDFVRAREGGVDGMFFAIYSPPELTDEEAVAHTEEEAVAHAVRLISKCYDAVDGNSDVAAFAFSPEQAFENKRKGLISVFLGMENGTPIQNDLAYLHLYHRFRYGEWNSDTERSGISASVSSFWHTLSNALPQ